MDGWKDHEALLVVFDESIHRVVLVLVELHLLSDPFQIEHLYEFRVEVTRGGSDTSIWKQTSPTFLANSTICIFMPFCSSPILNTP